MEQSSSFWDRVVAPYRAADWDECVRMLRPVVAAEPYELVSRHVLAGFYERLEQKRQALDHYERLLPLAMGRGDLLRAIAVQRRIDELDSKARAPGRYAAMRHALGGDKAIDMPGIGVGGTIVAALLGLEPEEFERVASILTVDRFDAAPRNIGTDPSSMWLVLHGCMRWRLTTGENDHASGEHIADQYHPVSIDADGPVRVRFEADLPTDCLHLEGVVAKRLGVGSTGRGSASGSARGPVWDPYQSFSEHERALMASRPRRHEDLDDASEMARRTMSEAQQRLDGAEPHRSPANGEDDWFGFNTLSLPVAAQSAQPAPVADEASSIEPADGVETTDAREAQLAAEAEAAARFEALDQASPADRRRSMRVAVAYDSRIALLGLTGPAARPLEGRLSDLSETGLGVCFKKAQLRHSLAALDRAVIRLDLGLPGRAAPLRLAGRVRWIEFSDTDDSARVGIEFVLLTTEDRAAILAALERAARSSGDGQMDLDPGSSVGDSTS